MDFTIRKIDPDDSQAIIALDGLHSGTTKPAYWQERLKPFMAKSNSGRIVLGYVAVQEGRVIGYILAEGRAWEFGSPLCGWIFAIGVDPNCGRKGVGLALCREVCRKFKSLDIRTVRTMVRKDNVDVLSFFRASGFRAGPFIELELEF
ncbi:MAG: GNAT family N-acetyltransferase [bacterium]